MEVKVSKAPLTSVLEVNIGGFAVSPSAPVSLHNSPLKTSKPHLPSSASARGMVSV